MSTSKDSSISKKSVVKQLKDENRHSRLTKDRELPAPSVRKWQILRASFEELVHRHQSLKFKVVYDPGLEEAFNYEPEPPAVYSTDGVQKYLDLTKALKIPVVKRFQRSLKESSVDLQYYGLQPRQMRAMSDALVSNTSVEEVNLEDNILDLDSMYHLGQMLRKNLHIRKLILTGCMIGTEGAAMLASGLDICQFLSYLDLSRNYLGDEGFEAIAPSFGYNTSIRTLILSHNNLTHKSGFHLAELLGENTTIENLDLSWNSMSQESGVKKMLLATGLHNNTLLNLNLAWNGLQGDKMAGFFRLFLIRHKGIRSLDISNNRFEGVAEMSKFAYGISRSETLRTFNIAFNPLKEADAYALLSGISASSPLRFLDLDYVWVNKEFDQLRKQAELNRGLKIRVGGAVEGKDLKGPDMQVCLLRRAHYLGFKPKKKKNRKDFGWFLLRLRDDDKLKPIKKSKFEELVAQDRIKFEDGLVDELAKKFRNEKKRIDLAHMLDVYLELFPKTKLPKSKGKKKKHVPNIEQEIAVENVVNQAENVAEQIEVKEKLAQDHIEIVKPEPLNRSSTGTEDQMTPIKLNIEMDAENQAEQIEGKEEVAQNHIKIIEPESQNRSFTDIGDQMSPITLNNAIDLKNSAEKIEEKEEAAEDLIKIIERESLGFLLKTN